MASWASHQTGPGPVSCPCGIVGKTISPTRVATPKGGTAKVSGIVDGGPSCHLQRLVAGGLVAQQHVYLKETHPWKSSSASQADMAPMKLPPTTWNPGPTPTKTETTSCISRFPNTPASALVPASPI